MTSTVNAGSFDVLAGLIDIFLVDSIGLGCGVGVASILEPSAAFLGQITELMRSKRPELRRPTLAFEIEGYLPLKSPLALLKHVGLAQLSLDPTLRATLPTILLGKPSYSASLGFQVADSHLHSGASVEVETLLRGLAEQRSPGSFSGVDASVLGRSGESYHLKSVMDVARWSVRLLWETDAGRAHQFLDSNPLLKSAISQVSFWRRVASELQLDPAQQSLVAEMRRQSFSTLGECPSIPELFWSAHERIPYSPDPIAWSCDLVRLLGIFVQAVESVSGEGLTSFAQRFRLAGDVRDAALSAWPEDSLKSQMVRRALANTFASRDVVGAEFRKTIAGRTQADLRKNLIAAINYHSEAFITFLRDSGRVAALAMPVSFTRIETSPSTMSAVDDLRGAVALANVVLEMSSSRPSAMNLVTSFDVVGDENTSENWPFIAIAGALSEAGLNIPFAIHAGEAFYSGVNGLRSIDESIAHCSSVTRVGHALALDERMVERIAGSDGAPIGRLSAVMDLCWILANDPNFDSEANDLMYKLVQPIPGETGIGIGDWVSGYLSLFTTDGLRPLGLLGGEGNRLQVPPSDDIPLMAAGKSAAARASFSLALGAAGRVAVDWTEDVTVADAAALRQLSKRAYPSLRDQVVERVRQSRVILEACPTSNLRLTGESALGEHPLWRWSADDLPVTVSSDDPLIFGTHVYSEYASLMEVGDSSTVEVMAALGVRTCAGGVRRTYLELSQLMNRGSQSSS
jgi:hypothetical protein